MNRRDALGVAAIWAVVLGVAVVLGDGAPALGAIGGVLTGWYLKMRKRRRDPRHVAARDKRECPARAEPMPRGASRCAPCGSDSAPWTLHEGVWWVRGGSGEWQWFDEDAGFFRWYRDGTPSTSAVGERSL